MRRRPGGLWIIPKIKIMEHSIMILIPKVTICLLVSGVGFSLLLVACNSARV